VHAGVSPSEKVIFKIAYPNLLYPQPVNWMGVWVGVNPAETM